MCPMLVDGLATATGRAADDARAARGRQRPMVAAAGPHLAGPPSAGAEREARSGGVRGHATSSRSAPVAPRAATPVASDGAAAGRDSGARLAERSRARGLPTEAELTSPRGRRRGGRCRADGRPVRRRSWSVLEQAASVRDPISDLADRGSLLLQDHARGERRAGRLRSAPGEPRPTEPALA